MTEELKPCDWRLVPVEPTEAMVDAGYDPLLSYNPISGDDYYFVLPEIFRAMAAAAPPPPNRGGVDLDELEKVANRMARKNWDDDDAQAFDYAFNPEAVLKLIALARRPNALGEGDKEGFMASQGTAKPSAAQAVETP